MKKIIAAMLLAVLLVSALSVHAEEMPVIDWSTPEPAATPEPTATPRPTTPPKPKATPVPVLQTGEITDSWEEIIAAVNDGSVKLRYAIGATKALDLGDFGIIHMQLAGFDLDTRSDGSGMAATTWIALEMLPDERPLHPKHSLDIEWINCDLRAYLQDTVLPAIPEPVRENLISVEKDGGVNRFTDDRLWIPGREEVRGEDSLYYDLFKSDKNNLVKYRNGRADSWWLRSVKFVGVFWYIYDDGDPNVHSCDHEGGIVLGFCL